MIWNGFLKKKRINNGVKYNTRVDSNRSFFNFSCLFFAALLSAASVRAEDTDENLLKSLKIDANQNLNRLKAFKEEGQINQVFDDEREKALGAFLEDQEKWDLVRERGLREYKIEKKRRNPGIKSAEYLEYLDNKESDAAIYERSRKIQVNVRNQVQKQIKDDNIGNLELQELGLAGHRPRYSLRDRSNNKWVNAGSRPGLGGSSGGLLGGGYQPPAPPPSSDFAPPPPAFESFEEVQPASPPPIFDSSSGITPFDGNGDMNIPPPPPPPDFDF